MLAISPRAEMVWNSRGGVAGQTKLMAAYERARWRGTISVKIQALLTLKNRAAPAMAERARDVETLLAIGAVPIISENDTVATTEIRWRQ